MLLLATIFHVCCTLSWSQPDETVVRHELRYWVRQTDGTTRNSYQETIPMPRTQTLPPPETGYPGYSLLVGEIMYFQLYGVRDTGCESNTAFPA